jgi:pyruvate/2-oxoacid:ferredoxin oxidoreductase alpha subunit
VIVCEMNQGQLIHEIERLLCGKEIAGVFKNRGEPIYPQEIVAKAVAK